MDANVKMTNEQFKEHMLNSTEQVFAAQKEVRPMLAMLDSRGLGLMPLSMKDKDFVATIIAKMRGMFPAVMFVSESWMVRTKDGKMPDVAPSQSPDREEVVMVVFYFAMETQSHFAKIIRPENGTPFLGPWESFDNISGRFARTPASWN